MIPASLIAAGVWLAGAVVTAACIGLMTNNADWLDDALLPAICWPLYVPSVAFLALIAVAASLGSKARGGGL